MGAKGKESGSRCLGCTVELGKGLNMGESRWGLGSCSRPRWGLQTCTAWLSKASTGGSKPGNPKNASRTGSKWGSKATLLCSEVSKAMMGQHFLPVPLSATPENWMSLRTFSRFPYLPSNSDLSRYLDVRSFPNILGELFHMNGADFQDSVGLSAICRQ